MATPFEDLINNLGLTGDAGPAPTPSGPGEAVPQETQVAGGPYAPAPTTGGFNPFGGYDTWWGPSSSMRADIRAREGANVAHGQEMAKRRAMQTLMTGASAIVEQNPGLPPSQTFRMLLQDKDMRKALMDIPAGEHLTAIQQIQQALNPQPQLQKFGSSIGAFDESGKMVPGSMVTSPSDKIQQLEWMKNNWNDPVARQLISQAASADKTQQERAIHQLVTQFNFPREQALRILGGVDSLTKDITGRVYAWDKATNTMHPVGTPEGVEGGAPSPATVDRTSTPGSPTYRTISPSAPEWTPAGEQGKIEPAAVFSKTVEHLKQLDENPTLVADVLGPKGTAMGMAGTVLGMFDPKWSQPLINASRQKIDNIALAVKNVAKTRQSIKAEYEDLMNLVPSSTRFIENPLNGATGLYTIARRMEQMIAQADAEPSRPGATKESVSSANEMRKMALLALKQTGTSAQWAQKIAELESGKGGQPPITDLPTSVGDVTGAAQKEVQDVTGRILKPGETTPPPAAPAQPQPQQQAPAQQPSRVKSPAELEAMSQPAWEDYAKKALEQKDISAAEYQALKTEQARRKKVLEKFGAPASK